MGGGSELDNSSSTESSFNSFTEKIAASSLPVSDQVKFKGKNSPSKKCDKDESGDDEKSEIIIIKGTKCLLVEDGESYLDDSKSMESSFPIAEQGGRGRSEIVPKSNNREHCHDKSASNLHESLFDSFREQFPGQKHVTTPLTTQSQRSNTFFSTSLFVPHENSQSPKNISQTRRHSFSTMPHLTQNTQDREKLIKSTKNNEKLVELVNVLTNKLSDKNKENQTLRQQINKLNVT